MINHWIITRFRYDDKELLKRRLVLMKEILIPALENQTCKNFSFVIVAHKEDYDLIENTIKFPVTFFTDYEILKKESIRQKATIQTRHDSDDWLRYDYVEKTQEIYKQNDSLDSFLIQFQVQKFDIQKNSFVPFNFVYHPKDISIFFSVCQPKEVKYTCYERQHRDMWQVFPQVITVEKGYCTYIQHPDNYMKLTPKQKEKMKF